MAYISVNVKDKKKKIHCSRLKKKKKEMTQITNMRNTKGDMTIDLVDIKRLLKEL